MTAMQTGWAMALVAVLAACETTVYEAPPGLDHAIASHVPADRAWVVEAGGEIVGSVVRYQEGYGAERFLFAVRNAHQQDVGLIDAQGRAFRYRPHSEPEWLGTGKVSEGVAEILDASAPHAEMREVSLEALELLEAPQ